MNIVKRFAAVNKRKNLMLCSTDRHFYTLGNNWNISNIAGCTFMSREAAQRRCDQIASPKFTVIEVEVDLDWDGPINAP